MSTGQIPLPFSGDFQSNSIDDIINRLERLYYLYLGLKNQQQELHEQTRAETRAEIERMVRDFRRPVEVGYRY